MEHCRVQDAQTATAALRCHFCTAEQSFDPPALRPWAAEKHSKKQGLLWGDAPVENQPRGIDRQPTVSIIPPACQLRPPPPLPLPSPFPHSPHFTPIPVVPEPHR